MLVLNNHRAHKKYQISWYEKLLHIGKKEPAILVSTALGNKQKENQLCWYKCSMKSTRKDQEKYQVHWYL